MKIEFTATVDLHIKDNGNPFATPNRISVKPYAFDEIHHCHGQSFSHK